MFQLFFLSFLFPDSAVQNRQSTNCCSNGNNCSTHTHTHCVTSTLSLAIPKNGTFFALSSAHSTIFQILFLCLCTRIPLCGHESIIRLGGTKIVQCPAQHSFVATSALRNEASNRRRSVVIDTRRSVHRCFCVYFLF